MDTAMRCKARSGACWSRSWHGAALHVNPLLPLHPPLCAGAPGPALGVRDDRPAEPEAGVLRLTQGADCGIAFDAGKLHALTKEGGLEVCSQHCWSWWTTVHCGHLRCILMLGKAPATFVPASAEQSRHVFNPLLCLLLTGRGPALPAAPGGVPAGRVHAQAAGAGGHGMMGLFQGPGPMLAGEVPAALPLFSF